jgi:hypothetical protein
MRRIQNGYNNIAYHNKSHAADVCQSAYFWIEGEFQEKANLTDLDLTSILIATSVHDFEHFAVNNVYLTETKHELALRYNDISILENHHIAASSKIMLANGTNIFENFTKEDYKEIKKKMITMVLATDMAKHFSDVP